MPHADVIQFITEDGPVATLFSFACHPVCCGKTNKRSADYVHAARKTVEAATGGPAIFITGCAGDANPFRRGGGQGAAGALGAALGAAVAEALAADASTPLSNPALGTARRVVRAPLEPPLEPRAADAFVAAQRRWLATAGGFADATARDVFLPRAGPASRRRGRPAATAPGDAASRTKKRAGPRLRAARGGGRAGGARPAIARVGSARGVDRTVGARRFGGGAVFGIRAPSRPRVAVPNHHRGGLRQRVRRVSADGVRTREGPRLRVEISREIVQTPRV